MYLEDNIVWHGKRRVVVFRLGRLCYPNNTVPRVWTPPACWTLMLTMSIRSERLGGSGALTHPKAQGLFVTC